MSTTQQDEPQPAKRRKAHHGDGSWEYDAGTRRHRWRRMVQGVRLTVTGASKAECRRLMADKVADLEEGILGPLAPERVTVVQYAERWLQTVKATRPASTWRTYDALLRHHVLPRLGTVALRRLRADQVQRALDAMLQEAKLAPKSVATAKAAVHAMLASAVRQRYLARNVATGVQLPRLVSRETEPLSRDECLRFLAAARGDPYEALYLLMLTVPLRPSEALGLRWQDIELDRRLLHVRVQITESALAAGDPARLFVPLKSSAGQRTVLLPAVAVAALERRRERQQAERILAAGAWCDLGLVFTREDGAPLPHGQVRRRAERLMRAGGIAARRFYALRHSGGTLLMEAGIPSKVIAERMGHASTDITDRVYLHVRLAHQQAAADALDALLRPPDSPMP